jgi:hypothetical protein
MRTLLEEILHAVEIAEAFEQETTAARASARIIVPKSSKAGYSESATVQPDIRLATYDGRLAAMAKAVGIGLCRRS